MPRSCESDSFISCRPSPDRRQQSYKTSSRRHLEILHNMATTVTETETIPVTRLEPITASNILRLFPDIDTSSEALDGHDLEQIRLMDEVCIVLDDNDKPIGNFSKKICMFSCLCSLKQSAKLSRPSHDQYRQRTSSPCLLSLPL